MLVVLDEALEPVESVHLYLDIRGSDGNTELEYCWTDALGQCAVAGTPVAGSGDTLSAAWSFTVGSAVSAHAGQVRSVMFESDGVEELTAALQAAGVEDALLAWRWDAGYDAALGDLAPSTSIVDSGSGLASLPIGVVITRAGMDSISATSTVTLEVDGVTEDVTYLTIDGAGLASLPIGFRSLSIIELEGTGLASLPIGVRPKDMYVMGATGEAIPLDGTATPTGEAFALQLDSGGWNHYGIAGASALMGSAAVFTQGTTASDAETVTVGEPQAF